MKKLLRKYTGSKYKQVLITHVILHRNTDGTAKLTIHNNGDTLHTVPMYMFYDEISNWSADYLLCDIQEIPELEVLK